VKERKAEPHQLGIPHSSEGRTRQRGADLKQQSRLIVVGHPCCQRVRPLAGERHQTGARSYAGYSNYSTSLISSTPPPQSSVLPLTLDTVAPAIKRAWTPAEIGATRRGVSFYWRIALLVGATFIVAGEETTSGQKSSDSPSDLTPRVIGGKNAAPGEYPWIVALHRKGAADYYEGHFCGGSLIYPYWVLTAALCVANISPDAVQVVVGAYNLLQPQNTQAIDVLDIIIHPDYVDPDNGDDIALILLAHPPDPLPQTVDLAFDPMTHPPGTNATVIGWETRSMATTSLRQRFFNRQPFPLSRSLRRTNPLPTAAGLFRRCCQPGGQRAGSIPARAILAARWSFLILRLAATVRLGSFPSVKAAEFPTNTVSIPG
jgi:hypothetical protein